jgi:hypothetical protein
VCVCVCWEEGRTLLHYISLYLANDGSFHEYSIERHMYVYLFEVFVVEFLCVCVCVCVCVLGGWNRQLTGVRE